MRDLNKLEQVSVNNFTLEMNKLEAAIDKQIDEKFVGGASLKISTIFYDIPVVLAVVDKYKEKGYEFKFEHLLDRFSYIFLSHKNFPIVENQNKEKYKNDLGGSITSREDYPAVSHFMSVKPNPSNFPYPKRTNEAFFGSTNSLDNIGDSFLHDQKNKEKEKIVMDKALDVKTSSENLLKKTLSKMDVLLDLEDLLSEDQMAEANRIKLLISSVCETEFNKPYFSSNRSNIVNLCCSPKMASDLDLYKYMDAYLQTLKINSTHDLYLSRNRDRECLSKTHDKYTCDSNFAIVCIVRN